MALVFFGTIIWKQILKTTKKNTMKTRTFLVTGLMVFALVLTSAFAKAETATFSKALSKTVKYPTLASENHIEGTLWLSIDVDENGIMKIDQSNHSCCVKLHDEVIKQLDGKKLKNFKKDMAGNHKLKLVFRIEK
jgi:hypothetical protein